MGRKRKDDGYNKGNFKEVEYFLKGLRAPIFKLLNNKSKYRHTIVQFVAITDLLWIRIIALELNALNVGS